MCLPACQFKWDDENKTCRTWWGINIILHNQIWWPKASTASWEPWTTSYLEHNFISFSQFIALVLMLCEGLKIKVMSENKEVLKLKGGMCQCLWNCNWVKTSAHIMIHWRMGINSYCKFSIFDFYRDDRIWTYDVHSTPWW